MDSGNDCGIVLRHALAYADELWRSAVVNKERTRDIASRLDLPLPQVAGAVRLLRSLKYVPSPERLALIAMNDFGLEDADIGEMWSRPASWAAEVRRNADELREAEPINRYLEYLDEGLRPQDPCPEELYRRAAEIRSKRPKTWRHAERGRVAQAPAQGGMRHYRWNHRHAAYVSIRAESWAGR
jgi:hypothetical protein